MQISISTFAVDYGRTYRPSGAFISHYAMTERQKVNYYESSVATPFSVGLPSENGLGNSRRSHLNEETGYLDGDYDGETVTIGGHTYTWKEYDDGTGEWIDENGDAVSNLKNAGDPMPLGDSMLPLLLFSLIACGYVFRRRRLAAAQEE